MDKSPLYNDVMLSHGLEVVTTAVSTGAPEVTSETGTNLQFPMSHPSKINSFINQDDNTINEGYDSEDDLLYHSEELLRKEINEDYNKSPIDIGNTLGAVMVIPPQKSLMDEIAKLVLKELKQELKKQGHCINGKKVDLCACLMEAIQVVFL